MRPQTVGLIAHTGKPGAAELVGKVCAEFARFSVPVLVEDATAELAQIANGYPIKDLAAAVDLLVVLGGDGTILNAVGRLGDVLKPIFGINIGSLGFPHLLGLDRLCRSGRMHRQWPDHAERARAARRAPRSRRPRDASGFALFE